MMPADDTTYTSWDRGIIQCGLCSEEYETEIWSDTRNLDWGFEAACPFCDDHEVVVEHADTPKRRIAPNQGFLLALGVTLLLAIAGAAVQSLPAFLAGSIAAVALVTAAALLHIDRKDQDS